MDKNSMKALVRRRGAVAALVATLGIFAYLTIHRMVESAMFALWGFSAGVANVFEFFQAWWGNAAGGLGLIVLPLCLGIFLSLWLLAPIAAQLGVTHVITRSTLAAGVGAVLILIAQGISAIFSSFNFQDALFGGIFPRLDFDGAGLISRWGGALQSTISTFVSVLPLVVLAGILLWIWLGKHPAKHPVAGMLDEV